MFGRTPFTWIAQERRRLITSITGVLFVGIVAFLPTGLAGAEIRTWTSTTGNTFKGKFVRVHEGYAVLSSGRKVVKVHPSSLCAEDQAYIREQIARKRKITRERTARRPKTKRFTTVKLQIREAYEELPPGTTTFAPFVADMATSMLHTAGVKIVGSDEEMCDTTLEMDIVGFVTVVQYFRDEGPGRAPTQTGSRRVPGVLVVGQLKMRQPYERKTFGTRSALVGTNYYTKDMLETLDSLRSRALAINKSPDIADAATRQQMLESYGRDLARNPLPLTLSLALSEVTGVDQLDMLIRYQVEEPPLPGVTQYNFASPVYLVNEYRGKMKIQKMRGSILEPLLRGIRDDDPRVGRAAQALLDALPESYVKQLEERENLPPS